MDARFYTGIGEFNTPPHILRLMTSIASALEQDGWTLRSGNCDGADRAFCRGIDDFDHKEVYLPWPRHNNSPSGRYNVTNEALFAASRFYPKWDWMPIPPKRIRGNRIIQLLGESLNEPSSFMVCWTPLEIDPGASGGTTNQSIKMAEFYKIPMYNLCDRNTELSFIDNKLFAVGREWCGV